MYNGYIVERYIYFHIRNIMSQISNINDQLLLKDQNWWFIVGSHYQSRVGRIGHPQVTTAL